MKNVSYLSLVGQLKDKRSELSKNVDAAVCELGVLLSKFDGSTPSGISLPALHILCQRFCDLYSAETAVLNQIYGFSDLSQIFAEK